MNAPAPKKKGTSGVVILLLIFGGFGLLLLVGVGVAVYMVKRSPEASGLLKVFTDVADIQAKAMKAPGTKELRALGCQQAMVMSIADFQRVLAPLDAGTTQTMPFDEMVVCSMSLLHMSSTPACDVAAKTYLAAVGPRKGPYLMMVQVQGKKDPECSVVYGADGTRMGNLDNPESFGPILGSTPNDAGETNPDETQ